VTSSSINLEVGSVSTFTPAWEKVKIIGLAGVRKAVVDTVGLVVGVHLTPASFKGTFLRRLVK